MSVSQELSQFDGQSQFPAAGPFTDLALDGEGNLKWNSDPCWSAHSLIRDWAANIVEKYPEKTFDNLLHIQGLERSGKILARTFKSAAACVAIDAVVLIAALWPTSKASLKERFGLIAVGALMNVAAFSSRGKFGLFRIPGIHTVKPDYRPGDVIADAIKRFGLKNVLESVPSHARSKEVAAEFARWGSDQLGSLSKEDALSILEYVTARSLPVSKENLTAKTLASMEFWSALDSGQSAQSSTPVAP